MKSLVILLVFDIELGRVWMLLSPGLNVVSDYLRDL